MPSTSLSYVDCFNGLQCARLQVPMDWNSTTGEDTVSVAIVRVPARVPVTDPRYGGPILFNPGGPGGPGAGAVIAAGADMQAVFDAAYLHNSSSYVSDEPSAKYFDIIGFDPRGVGNTTPFLTCHSDAAEQITWSLQGDHLVLGSPETNIDYLWQRSVALGESCPQSAKIANFMTTAIVARDMVEIVERHGEWRERQAANESTASQRLAWKKGEEPIQYFGISYGTVLGATLAAMQPHRVKRFLLDGVKDANAYFRGEWQPDVVDADEIMNRFFEYCTAAGATKCPFATNSTTGTQRRLDKLLANVSSAGPLAVAGSDGNGPSVITLSDIKKLLLQKLYYPMVTFPALATALTPLSSGNGSAYAAALQAAKLIFPQGQRSPGFPINPYDPTSKTHSWAMGYQIATAIAGGDAQRHLTKAEFMQYYNAVRSQSKYGGDVWATIWISVFSWMAKPKFRFGDTHMIASNVTAHPVLFASTTLDPVTPLASAKRMSANFRGSDVLVVDGEGHTTIASPSLCAVKAYRAYFQSGLLPKRGSVACLPQQRPFLGSAGPRVEAVALNATNEDKMLVAAALALMNKIAKAA